MVLRWRRSQSEAQIKTVANSQRFTGGIVPKLTQNLKVNHLTQLNCILLFTLIFTCWLFSSVFTCWGFYLWLDIKEPDNHNCPFWTFAEPTEPSHFATLFLSLGPVCQASLWSSSLPNAPSLPGFLLFSKAHKNPPKKTAISFNEVTARQHTSIKAQACAVKRREVFPLKKRGRSGWALKGWAFWGINKLIRGAVLWKQAIEQLLRSWGSEKPSAACPMGLSREISFHLQQTQTDLQQWPH